MFEFLSNDLVSLAMAQLAGTIILISARMSDTEIMFISGTYFDYNKHVIKQLVAARYDQWLGLFTVTVPTVLSALNDPPFYIGYVSLLIALMLRFSPIRTYYIRAYVAKIMLLHKENANVDR